MPIKIRKYVYNQLRKTEINLHELNYLFWECTRRCNLKCLHCGSDCISDSGFPDMPFEVFFNAMKPLSEKYKKDSITVVFTGGEPLLRNDLAACGRKLRENGFRWGIVTNGYMYNEKVHGELLGAGMGAITLSIDGLEENHNWLRGNQKSFSKALEAMNLIASSQRLNYDIVTCINKRNINDLNELKGLFVRNKIKVWRLFTIAPIGRARNNDALVLDSGELINLMDFISNSRKEKIIDIKFSCEAYTGKYEEQVRDSFFFCRAGINIASVLIDGSISACPNINRSFSQGNIYNDSFINIWESGFEIMRDRKWTKKGLCANCTEYKYCNGGALHLWDEERTGILLCHYKQMLNLDKHYNRV